MAVKTALVVDDSKSARIMLGRLVQKNGLTVELVESGEEAVSFLKTADLPDVIFMDHMMPGMSGLETTQVLTEDSRTKQIPIFMYTSKEGPEYEAEALASGAFGILGKPAKPERLAAIISELNSREEQSAAITTEPTIQETVIEEEEMSQELIEEVSSKLISRAIEDAIQPISSAIQRLDTSTQENKSEIRKLVSRQDNNINLVSQAVLDASLKQTTVQLQNQLIAEIKSIRDLLEHTAELSPATLQQIRDVSSQTATDTTRTVAEKVATSSAEAVAAKVGAAQAQIQVMQDMQPFMQQAKKANMLAFVSMLVAGAAIAMNFLL